MFLDKEINTEILDLIRLPHGNFSFSFDENKDFESKIIIPEDKKHESLIHNFKISEPIFDFYYIQTNRYLKDVEFQELQESGYLGYKKEYTLQPYSFEICGAPFHRIDLLEKVKLLSWEEPKKRPKINNKNIVKFSDLAPYFKEYAVGFKEGFEKFEESQITKYLPYLADKNDYIQKVFEFLTTEIILERSWLNNHIGFKIRHNSVSDVGKIINAFEDGIKQGYFYKAWTIVFSNNNLFTPLFEDYFKTKKLNNDSKETKQIKQLDLKDFYHNTYKGSELHNVCKGNPIPTKWTISSEICYCYSPEFLGLMALSEFVVKEWEIKPTHFAEDFKRGYLDGLKFLRKEEKIKIELFDEPTKRESIFKRLKSILFEREFKPNLKGILETSNSIPLFWTEDKIYNEGYYSGIMQSIDKFCESAGLSYDDFKENTKTNASEESKQNEPPTNANSCPKIFTDKGFQLWEQAVSEFNLKTAIKNPLTSLRFLFEIMKKEGLIHETVSISNFTDWVNEIDLRPTPIAKLHYTNPNDNSNSERLKSWDRIKGA